jgi:hypothetical protein
MISFERAYGAPSESDPELEAISAALKEFKDDDLRTYIPAEDEQSLILDKGYSDFIEKSKKKSWEVKPEDYLEEADLQRLREIESLLFERKKRYVALVKQSVNFFLRDDNQSFEASPNPSKGLIGDFQDEKICTINDEFYFSIGWSNWTSITDNRKPDDETRVDTFKAEIKTKKTIRDTVNEGKELSDVYLLSMDSPAINITKDRDAVHLSENPALESLNLSEEEIKELTERILKSGEEVKTKKLSEK